VIHHPSSTTRSFIIHHHAKKVSSSETLAASMFQRVDFFYRAFFLLSSHIHLHILFIHNFMIEGVWGPEKKSKNFLGGEGAKGL
jgi:hypothetical protein